MLLESLHRGGTTERDCRWRGVTMGYTQVSEKGPEFGDEAATTDDDSHDGLDSHDGNNDHDGRL